MSKKKQETPTVKPENAEKLNYAYLLFMQKVPQKEICQRVGITEQTFIRWKKQSGWEEKRAAKTISIDDIVGKTLQKISGMLDNDEHFNADAFAKAVAQLKSLKGSGTVNDAMSSFDIFLQWLVEQRAYYPAEITDEFLKKVAHWQDQHIQYRLGNARKN